MTKSKIFSIDSKMAKHDSKYDANSDITDGTTDSQVNLDKKGLKMFKRISYGFGNVLNDLCATVWFTYLLVYLNFVAQLNNVLTGYLMLIGQISDAVATILFGFITDRTCGSNRYGRRKTWHIIGCIAVALTFAFLQNTCFICTNDASSESQDWLRFSYYLVFIVIFQFGWALNQISHLALIPELSSKQSERVGLSSVRHAFTVISSVTVYAIAFVLLGQNDDGEDTELSPNDQNTFTILSSAVIGIGILFTALFHLIIKERPGYNIKEEEHKEKECVEKSHIKTEVDIFKKDVPNTITWKGWLKEHQLYQIGTLYTATRVVVISSQVYIPFYVNSTLHLDQQYIAIIPLIIYAFSFATALVMKHVNKLFGRKLTYGLGSLVVLSACAWMWFISEENRLQVLGAAMLLGIGTSTIYVTALAIIADLIGTNTETGGFVYGVMSFAEKLINGGTVAMVQYLYPCMSATCCSACVLFYRQVVVFVPSGATIIALLFLASLLPFSIGALRFQGNKSSNTVIDVMVIDTEDPVDAGQAKNKAKDDKVDDNGETDSSDCQSSDNISLRKY